MNNINTLYITLSNFSKELKEINHENLKSIHNDNIFIYKSLKIHILNLLSGQIKSHSITKNGSLNLQIILIKELIDRDLIG